MGENYQPKYDNSWALVIGINNYKYAPILEYAQNDAKDIAEILIEKYQFKREKVITLFDGQATKKEILSRYMKFSQSDISENDRMIFFFAGHGETVPGNRADVGYLIPVDGNPEDISTFIRWDELTRGADLIKAKHIFFILDACFSGLAITRTLSQGNTRYLNSMLERYSRQVLAAGKADETVADANGPIPKHSIFTGHLLQALNGGFKGTEGIITANLLMAYVGKKVSTDQYSNQTPHYGYIEGDGDFVFNMPEPSKDQFDDVLVEVPILSNGEKGNAENELLEKVKNCLSKERGRIDLDAIIAIELRQYLALTAVEHFPLEASNISNEDIRNRLQAYDKMSKRLQIVIIAVSHWGNTEYVPVLKKIITRLSDQIESNNGNLCWLHMRWYPIYLLTYVAIIGAIESDRYNVISEILTMNISDERYNNLTLIESLVKHMLELDRMDLFDHAFESGQKYHAPRSEYIFKTIQPVLDDVLFLGKSYEHLFDKADALIALIYYDITKGTEEKGWLPPGRFVWKYTNQFSAGNVFSDILNDASLKKEKWPPLQAGLFAGSYERFEAVAKGAERFFKKLNWW